MLPDLDVAAIRAYCEQVVPSHALHEVRMEAVPTRGAVTIVERVRRGAKTSDTSGRQAGLPGSATSRPAVRGRSIGETITALASI